MTNPRIEIPTPDPTRLTTEQLDKAILSLREILESRLKCVDENYDHIVKRLDARSAAIKEGTDHLAELVNEKFSGIKTQFAERDTRTESTARDTKVAVDAALQAAEKAVGKQNESFAIATAKSETTTVKQIDAISVLITATNKATDDKITDIKGSISRIDALLASLNGRSKGIGDGLGWLFGGIGLIVAILALFFHH
jgi:NADH dehydrogenase/NADH:ubiquinone oxidoreductase subunit G